MPHSCRPLWFHHLKNWGANISSIQIGYFHTANHQLWLLTPNSSLTLLVWSGLVPSWLSVLSAKLLLALASTVILGFRPCRTHDPYFSVSQLPPDCPDSHSGKFLLVLTIAFILGSGPWGTHGHIFLSHDSESRATPSSDCPGLSRAKLKSKLLYDWQFTANQFVLAPSPLRIMTRVVVAVLQLNPWGHSPHVTSSPLRGGQPNCWWSSYITVMGHIENATSSSSSVVVCVFVAAETCLLSHCLIMSISCGSSVLAVRHHVTVWNGEINYPQKLRTDARSNSEYHKMVCYVSVSFKKTFPHKHLGLNLKYHDEIVFKLRLFF
jgi:hypothetical protein